VCHADLIYNCQLLTWPQGRLSPSQKTWVHHNLEYLCHGRRRLYEVSGTDNPGHTVQEKYWEGVQMLFCWTQESKNLVILSITLRSLTHWIHHPPLMSPSDCQSEYITLIVKSINQSNTNLEFLNKREIHILYMLCSHDRCKYDKFEQCAHKTWRMRQNRALMIMFWIME
jgi:hypothetical protein